MCTHKCLYDEMSQMNSLRVEEAMPVHLFTVMENPQGSVACNVEGKLVVLTLARTDDLRHALRLVAVALDEMLALETGTLVYDIRGNPAVEGTPADTALRTALIEGGTLTRLAVMTVPGSLGVETEPVRHLLEMGKVERYQVHNFSELVRVLQGTGPALALACSASEQVPDFRANYGGSVFSVPEMNATVIRASGKDIGSECFRRLLHAAIGLHVCNQASTLIFDTADSPPIEEVGGYEAFYRTVITPVAALGVVRTLVHVHLDELGQTLEAVPFYAACAEWGVFGCEAGTLAEAFTLVRALKGFASTVAPRVPGGILTRT